jgi:hypothetical protein
MVRLCVVIVLVLISYSTFVPENGSTPAIKIAKLPLFDSDTRAAKNCFCYYLLAATGRTPIQENLATNEPTTSAAVQLMCAHHLRNMYVVV